MVAGRDEDGHLFKRCGQLLPFLPDLGLDAAFVHPHLLDVFVQVLKDPTYIMAYHNRALYGT